MSDNVIKLTLPKPHKNQEAILNSQARYRICQCGRRFGKSLLASIVAVTDMLAGKYVAYVSPTHDLNKQFFKDFLKLLPKQIIKNDNKSELYIELITGGSIKFFSGEALDQFRGRKFHLVIIDEAAYIPNLNESYNSSIRPTLTDFKGKLLVISTPKGKGNYFEALFLKGRNGEPGYESFHYTSYQNPFIDSSEIDEARLNIPEPIFNQEYLAISGENAANAFGVSNIDKNIIPTLSTKPSIVYGIDLAKYTDWSVIAGLDEDGCLSYFNRFQAPWEVTVDRIKSLPSNVIKAIDSTSIGDVICERLETEGVKGIVKYSFTNSSKANLIYKLIKDVEKGAVRYNQTTADEMHSFEYKITKSNNITYGAVSGAHDDCVIALSLAAYHKPNFDFYKNWKLYIL